MAEKINVLFVCIHNSARSQMAEAFLKEYGESIYEAYSAGLEPGNLNPFVIKVMKEMGIDISGNRTKSVSEFLNSDKRLDHVITVCDGASGERCPFFPGNVKRSHWEFEDPSAVNGSDEVKLDRVRKIRDKIKERIILFIMECKNG